MVSPIYILVGQDDPAKDIRINKLKQESFPEELEKFNFDILYARELGLRVFQERLLCLPVKAKRRVILVRDAEALRPEIKEFIIKFAAKPCGQVILILDIKTGLMRKSGPSRKEDTADFIRALAAQAQVLRFKERTAPDNFALGRQINSRRPALALRVLNQLLEDGQKPEWILGALRYSVERDIRLPLERRKRIKLLFDCDVDIKTGRLKPHFALERLIVRLCCLR